MTSPKLDIANLLCGLLFLALGAFFALQSLRLDIGTTVRMGPGSFPLLLAAALILLGLVVLAGAFRGSGEAIGTIPWRGLMFILPAPVLFGLTVRGLGFVPALFFTTLIAAFASRRMTGLKAIVLATGLTVFSTLLFSYALGLPYAHFGPWLGI